MRKYLILTLIFFNLSFGQDFLSEFQKVINKSKGFEAELIQKTYQSGFNNPDTFIGEVKATKPLTVKIDYKKPYQQTIFMNKEKIILYNKEQNQAIITSPQNSLLITDVISMFIDNTPIDKIFKVIQTKEFGKFITIDLKPKNSDDIKSLQITVEKEKYIPKTITAIDTDNNKIELQLENFKYYNNLVNLEFKLPKNVEIIQQ
ncbi:outer-membrane lipoprotein carrier protein LolA [Sulfurihydrogenibium sp.]|uniref:LolA family protein n=1 Tax=Sulfurihydrogenibium sp. TaxID=2053621 RepID=UPI0026199C9E|nr:outer-membrane lipoprotein carrier protein LolA [Sulfurihydrogenibium sp.]